MVQGQRTNYTDAWCRTFREAAGLSLEEAAQRAGISKVFLNHVERGRKHMSQDRADRLAGVLSAVLGVELSAEDLFPSNGMKSPREAALYYHQLVRERRDEQRVSEDEFDRDMASLDSPAGAAARDRYYKRQDPESYQPWTLDFPDGRVLVEQPPKWFQAQMQVPRPRGRREARPRQRRTSRRARSSRGSADDSDGPADEPRPSVEGGQ